MTPQIIDTLKLFIIFIPIILFVGVYCLLVTRNLIRTLIGLEVIMKAVTLLIALAGYATGNINGVQQIIITMIVVEVVFMAVAAGIIISVYKSNQSLDVRNLQTLKG